MSKDASIDPGASPRLGEEPFVCLLLVLIAVVARVDIDDARVDSFRSLNRCKDQEDPSEETKKERASLRPPLVRAEAAQLLLSMMNRPPEKRPRWHRKIGEFVLIDESAAGEGLKFLVDLARVPMAMSFSTRIDRPNWEPPVFEFPTELRRNGPGTQIGFDRGEIIAYLNEQGTPHTLAGEPAALHGVKELAADATDAADQPTPARRKIKRRGPGATAIELAEELALRPDDYRSVYDKLVDLSHLSDGERPWGLRPFGYNNRVGIWFETQSGQDYQLTLPKLRNRFRREAAPVSNQST